MAKYTTYLYEVVESGYDLDLQQYPIFNEEYREVLNNKILQNYWFDEIGQETVDRFSFMLNTVMDRIMPYYNQLYNSKALEFDPFLTFEKNVETFKNNTNNSEQKINNKTNLDSTTTGATDETTTFEHDIVESADRNTVNTTDSVNVLKDKDVSSDTPQDLLLVVDVNSDTYATAVSLKESTTNNDSSQVETATEGKTTTDNSSTTIDTDTVNIVDTESNSDTTNKTDMFGNEIFTSKESGFDTANISELLLKYRETFINVDLMVINDTAISDLFMKVY